jgi:hypothetical protein
MKRMVDFKSFEDVHYINLEDVLGSAVFTELGGDVRISDGLFIKAGLKIGGQNIQELEAVQSNGVANVLLHYIRDGKPVTHLLGETDKLPTAQAWVARVNQIYERMKKSRLEACEDASTNQSN